jgi:hypothetical protein
MLLTDLISLSTDLSSLSTTEAITYLQKAYYVVVDNIRLEPGIFPMLNKGEWFAIQKFDYLCERVGSNSEIAFKQIRDFIRTDFSQDNNYVITDFSQNDRCVVINEPLADKPIIGYPELEFFGFDEVDYDAMNAEHTVMPELFNSKQYYHLKNIDDITSGFCHIVAYQYPYPVHTVNGSYADEYRYNIQWMIDTYGIEVLEVDDVLGMLMLLKACQFYREDNLDIQNAKHYDYICTEIINMFNANRDQIHNNRLTTNGFMRFSI